MYTVRWRAVEWHQGARANCRGHHKGRYATIGISPALYTNYSHTPLATPFAASAKVRQCRETSQVYANNTGYGQNFGMFGCAYCWIGGVEGNYTMATRCR